MSYVVQTKHLTKAFHEKEVVSNVTMTIKKGEIYGLLGANGAGKTTILKMITNLIKPTSGEIELFGEKLTPTSHEIRKRIGSIIEYPLFYDKLTARENLDLHCEYMGYYDKQVIDTVLQMVHLQNSAHKAVKDLSLGMKQRLGIARAMITKPELLLLDEPTNGLDPVGINEFRSLFTTLSREYGIAIVMSSHILGEIEQVADTIGVIHEGQLIKEVSLDSIRESNTEYIELLTDDCQKAVYVLEYRLLLRNVKVIDNAKIRIYEPGLVVNDLIKDLLVHDVMIEGITKKSSSLEDYFLNLINGGGLIVSSH
ncbi:ABC transporter ATP-binding protein [Aneurinibacillus uraniidurans]|uniref:ABC transporter ATP-binding protein n=1 Tax=Aneurinibacillus uraniidurans TaxID=2966586 RepID=UPI00234B92EE|nr:ABC transporter ATP-binding protein [Aneurinibacillus sp. B1]WCN36318.1 ABC transporter ATP-binding protein [Aneurinibacillus sp. B1]